MSGDRAVWRHCDRIAFVDSPGRVAMVRLDRLADPPMLLTESAAAIWDALDGRSDTVRVTARVAGEYGVAPEDVAGDVEAFLADLAGRGLVQRVA